MEASSSQIALHLVQPILSDILSPWKAFILGLAMFNFDTRVIVLSLARELPG